MTVSWPRDFTRAWDRNTRTWMSQLDDQVQLRDLSIPGTHDSISRLGACHHISTTQYATLEEQLDAGIRFFDLRVKTDSGRDLKMVHGIEDIGDYYAGSGRLHFATVLRHIYAWMDRNPGETVIIKVVDAGVDMGEEPANYDVHERVLDCWQAIDDASSQKRLALNLSLTTDQLLSVSLGRARDQILLWRVFKDPRNTVVRGQRREFGLNLYKLKDPKTDNQPRFDVTSPSSDIDAGEVHALQVQSLYTWKYSSPKHLRYADKMNAILHQLHNAWCGHTAGIWQDSSTYFSLNELNIAASDGQDSDLFSYYPITNATYINPLIHFLLDQLLEPSSTLPALIAGEQSPSGLGVLLFDWAEFRDAARDYQKTRACNEPIYAKVIRFNFQASKMFARGQDGEDSLRYRATSEAPYVVLQYKSGTEWVDLSANPTLSSP